MALWQHGPSKNWNTCRGLVTTAGVYASIYRPGASGEQVVIRKPDGTLHPVHTPALGDWFLAAEDGLLTVYYSRIVEGGHDLARVPTAIECGQQVGHIVTGGVGLTGPAGAPGAPGVRGEQGLQGPQGPAGPAGSDANVTPETIDAIARRVWTLPPGDLANISGVDLGTLAQEVLLYALTQRQDLWQLVIRRIDEAAANLLAENYQPKVS